MSLNIINYILTPIELICCLIFYAGFCDTSRQLKKKKGIYWLILSLILSSSMVHLLQHWLWLKIPCVVLLFILLMKIYFGITFKHSLILGLLYIGILAVSDYLSLIFIALI